MTTLRRTGLSSDDIQEIIELLNLYFMHLTGTDSFKSEGPQGMELHTPATEDEREAIIDRLDAIVRKLPIEKMLAQRGGNFERQRLADRLAETLRENLQLKRELSKLRGGK